MGYAIGAEKLDDVLAWCCDFVIPAVTLWVCSIDNLKRSEAEICSIFTAVEAKIGALVNDPATYRRGVRVKADGRLNLLPHSTLAVLRRAEAATAGHKSLMLTIAIAYDGREEIGDAVRALLRDKAKHGEALDATLKEVTPSAIDNYLCTAGLPDLDLIVRTSGEVRLSGVPPVAKR